MYYTCSASVQRATWYAHVWGTTQDNGYSQHLRCYYGSGAWLEALGKPESKDLGEGLRAVRAHRARRMGVGGGNLRSPAAGRC